MNELADLRLPAPDIDVHPFTYFAETAARLPDRIAVDDGGRRLTYAQLDHASRALAEIIDRDVPAGGLVAILVPIDARFPVALLACLRANRPFAPVDPAYPAPYVTATLDVGGPAAIIVAPETAADALPAGMIRIDLAAPDPDHTPPPLPTLPPLARPDPNAVGIVLFTSGSTGLPKGVALPTRMLLRVAHWMARNIGLGPGDRMLPLQSFCTSVGMLDCYTAIVTGAGLRVAHVRTAGLGEVEAALRFGGVTVVSMVPSLLRALLRLPDAAAIFAGVRLLRLSGEPVLDGDVAAARAVLPPNADFLITFGASELVGILARVVPPDEIHDPGPVPIGLPYDDIRVTLEDETGQEVPHGAEGLLTIRGQSVAFGYWNAGVVDRRLFPADPDWPGARILRTGDLFRARADGVLCIIGRADRQVKINGIRVEPGQTESVLRAQPYVTDAAVLARQSATGPVLVAFAALAPGARPGAAAGLRPALTASLPPVQRPARLHVLAEIPRLAGFKIDQTALLALDDARLDAPLAVELSLAAGPVADARILDAVLRAWERLRGHPPSRPDIAFDDDGGDSLQLLQLIFRVEKDLRCSLRPEFFDLGMNAAALARAIDAVLRGDAGPTGATPVLFLPGVGGVGPQVARFRAACAPELDIQVLDYGNWSDWLGARKVDFATVLDRLEAEILARVPDGPLLLAGYSLGGLAAFLLAPRLHARGRTIGFLGLIDSGADTAAGDGPPQRAWHGEIARLWQPAARGGGLNGLTMTAARLLVTRPAAPLLRFLSRRRALSLPGDVDLLIRRHLNMLLLIHLSGRWRKRLPRLPRLEDVPVVLFRCEGRADPSDAPDLGWSAHCDDLTVVPVTGNHASLLEPPHLDGLRDRFTAAVAEALAHVPRGFEPVFPR